MSTPVKNIIYIVAHDLGRELGAYGSDFDTPHFDRFAREGVLFREAYCVSPCCSPSRGCAMTGMTAHSNGLTGLANPGWQWSLPESTRTIVDDLNDHGFETVHAGLQHERQQREANRYQINLPGESWVETAVDSAIDYLLQRRKDQKDERPFYLNLGTNEVHSGQWQTYKHDRDHTRGEDLYGIDNPDTLNLPDYLPDLPQVRREWGAFKGCVRYWDKQIGRLLECIRELDYDKDTLVVVTTDHGVLTHRGKGTVYKEGVETALAMQLPRGMASGVQFDEILGNTDLLPTLLEAVGVQVRPEVQGQSCWPLLVGEDFQQREHLCIERNFHDDWDPMRSIRTKDFVLIENFLDSGLYCFTPDQVTEVKDRYHNWFIEMWPENPQLRPRLEFFDRRSDPGEFSNVADDPRYTDTVNSLRAELHRWMRETDDPLLATANPDSFQAMVDRRFSANS